MSSKIPQLRIAVTHPCGKYCVYCRPGGETAYVKPGYEMSKKEIFLLVELMVRHGITDIKLTGGDPMLREDILEIVKGIKQIEGVKQLHIVTRHHRAGELLEELIAAGVDCLNFSLDSLNPVTWYEITKSFDHDLLIKAIEKAGASLINLKINTVVMKGVNDIEIYDLIDFAGKLRCTIKFLDLITDIPKFGKNFKREPEKKYFDLEFIIPFLEKNAIDFSTDLQPGGLGHPMQKFKLRNGATVILKSSLSGAWYGDICRSCQHYPCHDALMALRVTPDGQLQKCLLREDNMMNVLKMVKGNVDLAMIDLSIAETLNVYKTAQFHHSVEIDSIRNSLPESVQKK